jgi:hypothetical protein
MEKRKIILENTLKPHSLFILALLSSLFLINSAGQFTCEKVVEKSLSDMEALNNVKNQL